MSTSVNVESTLEAIMDSVDHDWRKQDIDDLRAHLEALETALQAIIARWEAAKARHGVQVGDPEYIAIARAALTAVAEAKE